MANHKVIAIGRQFGSGGREIGEKLAEKLGYKFYDKEILHHAAEQSGLHIDFFEQHDEKRTSSFLYTLVTNSHFYGHGNMAGSENAIGTQLYIAQANAIKSLAESDNCVMVGRCADYFLKDYDNLTSVFIRGDMGCRIKRIMERYNMTEKNAQDMIKKMDKSRSSYYSSTTGLKWGESKNYDLCINSSKLGIEGTVNLIATFIENEIK